MSALTGKWRMTVLVECDGEERYRIPVDPQCLHVTETMDGRRAHIAHADGCSCGRPPIKLAQVTQ